jgi:hypothetical protein
MLCPASEVILEKAIFSRKQKAKGKAHGAERKELRAESRKQRAKRK